MKKRRWRVRRDIVQTADVQRRWDHAYQLLIQWSQASPGAQIGHHVSREAMHQEEFDENCHVCAGVYAPAGTNAHD
jgi:hypothetical protein